MDNIRAELDKLSDNRLAYVMARSMVNNDAQGYKEAGIARATFYSWQVEERDALNELAQKIKRDTVAKAIRNLQDNAFEASEVLIKLLKSRDDRVKLNASTQVLDRTAGKPQDKIDITSEGEQLKVLVEYANSKTDIAEVS
jgi:N-methylhydantoinase B/oxoprolinase/acetone carboxylase alpha subunit